MLTTAYNTSSDDSESVNENNSSEESDSSDENSDNFFGLLSQQEDTVDVRRFATLYFKDHVLNILSWFVEFRDLLFDVFQFF